MNGRNYSSDSRCQPSTEKSSQLLTEAALVLGHHSLNLHLYLPKCVLYLQLDMWTLQVHFMDCSVLLNCYFSSLPWNLKYTSMPVINCYRLLSALTHLQLFQHTSTTIDVKKIQCFKECLASIL